MMALREQVDILMTQRVTAEGGWDDQINAFTEFVAARLEEQRQMCAAKVISAYNIAAYTKSITVRELREILLNACLNATGESDE